MRPFVSYFFAWLILFLLASITHGEWLSSFENLCSGKEDEGWTKHGGNFGQDVENWILSLKKNKRNSEHEQRAVLKVNNRGAVHTIISNDTGLAWYVKVKAFTYTYAISIPD